MQACLIRDVFPTCGSPIVTNFKTIDEQSSSSFYIRLNNYNPSIRWDTTKSEINIDVDPQQ